MSPFTEHIIKDKDGNLASRISDFQRDVKSYIQTTDPSRVVLATAWLISDNVIIDLFKRFTDVFPSVVAVDTLHLFPETHGVVKAMEEVYNFKAHIFKPEGCDSLEDFEVKYGKHNAMSHTDFD
eukprot:Ihof_evm5s353 gene=Ihof_evmTU5s353